jgi:tetratricopeptide (TPR) repeat protein
LRAASTPTALSAVLVIAASTPVARPIAPAALKALKRFPEALASFEQALSFKADFYPSLRGRSDALTILERFEEAIAAASAASAVRPEDPSPYSDRAFAELKLRRLDDALEHYEQALGLGDASPETRRLQAIALSQRAVELDKEGDLAKAEAYYNKAIDFEATESRLFNRAFLYMRTGRTDEAIEGYKAVAAMSPANFQARAALGTLLLQREAFADAIPALKEAEELNPSAADITFNLGFAYLRENRVDEAEAQFKKALEADPTLENAKNGLEAVEAARGHGKMTLTVGESVEVPTDAAAASSTVGGAAASSASAPTARSTGAAATPAATSSAAASRPMGSGSPAAGRRDARASVPPQLMGALSAAVRGPAMVSMAAAAAGASAAGSADDEAKFATDTDGVDGVVHPYDALKAPGPYPGGVDTTHREVRWRRRTAGGVASRRCAALTFATLQVDCHITGGL